MWKWMCFRERAPIAERAASEGSEECCWICHGASQPLVRGCACPTSAHAVCMARWQLRRAGTREELRCRFCDQELSDWKAALTPDGVVLPKTATMSVTLDGRTQLFITERGPEGRARFEADVRRAFRLEGAHRLAFTFSVQEPVTDDHIAIQGSYDAAFHCAALVAVRRGAI